MRCFSLEWIEQILIWVIVICAIIAILKLIIPWALSQAGVELGGAVGIIVQVLKIVFWAVVAIIVVIIVFMLISCLLSFSGGLHLPLPR